ncbi:hypothetical protein QBC34DRAFT_401646 [Podospora aff. communis PSN243]|uniref:Uncharacterized protein n=1 Tax=Podospora aff. communis PSN243 TaxID=3040156 RepID=A0AAV9GSF9_9PEZI|nr:hypothetical protein QBC34DRAFT_401646 [Podospora aff. communis PSN243]
MTTRWDPETLFDLRGIAPQGDIQCSGRCGSESRKGRRCGWTTERWNSGDDDRVDAQVMLSNLGRKHPSEITMHELTQLAAVCLCGNWHKGQRGTIARRWMDQVDALAPTIPNDMPPVPSTPERASVSQPPPFVFHSGNLTPPSSQRNANSFSFIPPHALGPPPPFFFGANTADQQLRDAQTQITSLTSEIETLNITLAQKDLDRCTISDELAGTRQQLATASAELSSTRQQLAAMSSENDRIKQDVASQLLKLKQEKDRELRAADFEHTTELTRLREKATKDLDAQAQGHSSRLQQAEKERDAAQMKFRTLRQEADAKLTSAAERNRALSQEVAMLKGQLEAAAAQNASLVKELGDTQEALDAAGQRAVELERELREERERAIMMRERQRRSWPSRLWQRLMGRRSESWV